jgi:hypothetical protein
LSKPNFISRAVQKIRTPAVPERRPHPFDVYFDPDGPAPQQDRVTFETLTPEQMNRRAGRLTDEQIAGVHAEAAVRQQIEGKRYLERTRAQLVGGR